MIGLSVLHLADMFECVLNFVSELDDFLDVSAFQNFIIHL